MNKNWVTKIEFTDKETNSEALETSIEEIKEWANNRPDVLKATVVNNTEFNRILIINTKHKVYYYKYIISKFYKYRDNENYDINNIFSPQIIWEDKTYYVAKLSRLNKSGYSFNENSVFLKLK